MGNAIMERLRRHQFAYSSKHLVYEGAGHAIGRPYTPTTDLDKVRVYMTVFDGSVIYKQGGQSL